MSLTCNEIVRAALGEPVKKSGKELLYRCPNHDDKHPSLSINSDKDCWLCGPCNASGNAWALAAFLSKHTPTDKPEIVRWLIKKGLRSGDTAEPKIQATYDYRDKDGRLVYQVLRYSPKNFRVRRSDGLGGWVWNLDGLEQILYNLPEVMRSKYALVVEGEKDVDTAKELGLVATCNPFGAGNWRPEFSNHLKGKKVAVIADADDAGRKHAEAVARSLCGAADLVKLIELPSAKDLTEWIKSGRTKNDLIEILKTSPRHIPSDIAPVSKPPKSGFDFVTLENLFHEPEEKVEWIVEDLLPARGFSMIASKPKVGKSTLARGLALSVSQGEPFLGYATYSGGVIYLALEEKRSEVKKHFQEMGATGNEQIHIHIAHAPLDAFTHLQEAVNTYKPVLIIIDPLLKMMRVKDGNDYALVTHALEPFLTLARESGAHLLVVHHLGKGERVDAADAILGSTAYFAGVDTVLLLKRTDRYRTIQTQQRYGEGLEETVLDFDPQTRTFSMGLSKSKAEVDRISSAMMEFLRQSARYQTEDEITQSVEAKLAVKRAALRSLYVDGKIARNGGGKKGDPFRYGIPKDNSFSRSQYILGTRERESEEVDQATENIGSILVPDNSSNLQGEPESREREFEEGEL